MDGSLGTQAGLRPFLPTTFMPTTFIPTTREQQDRITSAGNNIHPNLVHPQYLQSRQQHTSFSGSPIIRDIIVAEHYPIPWTVKAHIRTTLGAKFLSFELFLMALPNMPFNIVLNFGIRALTN